MHFATICHIVGLYIKFNLRYLKNLKLFPITVKELFETIVLQRKGDGCLLFLKAFSRETDIGETARGFRAKKIEKGNYVLTKNR